MVGSRYGGQRLWCEADMVEQRLWWKQTLVSSGYGEKQIWWQRLWWEADMLEQGLWWEADLGEQQL